MASSGAVELATTLSGLDLAQARLNAQVSVQAGALELQKNLIEQLLAAAFAELGQGVNLNLIA